MAHIADIFVAPEGSRPMESVERVEAVAGRGLRGDRYFNRTGYYTPYDVCQVTLMASEAVETVADEFGVDLSAGQHRRNLLTAGLDVRDLLGHRFAVGDATLEGTRPRPPCAHVERLADQEGVARALGGGRGGVCADVVESGTVAVGDPVEIGRPVDRTDGIVERLRSDAE